MTEPEGATPNVSPEVERERQLLVDARKKGTGATLGAFFKLSGPGWLQSAITLGGGSLSSSLLLGMLGGMAILWVQPLAMLLGIIMLSAISYVTLSTGERPFDAINRHVNPVLGWGWALATLMANMVWSMPQFALGTQALMQNLLPGIGEGKVTKLVVVLIILAICSAIVMLYDSGRKGVKAFDILLKVMVAIIVISFFGVVAKMTFAGGLDWGAIFAGFIPNPKLLVSPPESVMAVINSVDPAYRDFWFDRALGQQRGALIAAAATAVGINMTFLLPYSMLKRGWNKDFRGLAVFDLSTGMLIPFMLATTCIVVAAASQFHGKPAAGMLGERNESGELIQPAKSAIDAAQARLEFEIGAEACAALSDEEKGARIQALPEADRRMAGLLVKRSVFNLAQSLEPLTGRKFSQIIFGIGVVGMAFSTAIILMLINGFVVCEMLGIESKGWPYRIACLLPGVTGAIGAFYWQQAPVWLIVPTSVFGLVVLPIAYLTFYLLMNQKALLGENLPRGGRRVAWNLLMAIAALTATAASVWKVWNGTQWKGMAAIAAFIVLALVVQVVRKGKGAGSESP